MHFLSRRSLSPFSLAVLSRRSLSPFSLAVLLSLLALLTAFTAPAAQAQSAPQAVSIAVGSDNLTRILWNNADGSVSLWRLNASGPPTVDTFGPYAGWTGISVALGANDVPRILWDMTNGETSIYWVNETDGSQTNRVYGPYTGWTAQGLGIGNDNVPRVMWNHTADSQMALWSINDANGAFTSIPYGPYTSYIASLMAVGSNNQPRILWNKTDASISLWNVAASGNTFTSQTYGPYAGYAAVALTVDAGNLARVLWNHPSDGTVALWTVAAAGTYTNVFYTAPSGYSAKAMAAGSDGSVRLLWTGSGGAAQVWNIAADGTITTTVFPAPASVTFLPASVTGGASSTGTVLLTAPAPAGGTVVTLSSSTPSAVVPSSVTVAAGAVSATFSVTTTAVSASTTAMISASAGGVMQTGALTIYSATSGPAHWTVSYQSSGMSTSTPAGVQGSPHKWNDGTNSNGAAPGSGTAATYTCDCQDTITPVLTWTPGFIGDTTPVPDSATIIVNSVAAADSYGAFGTGSTHLADNGLDNAGSNAADARYFLSQGYKVYTVDNSQHKITVVFTPVTLHASVTMPSTASPYPSEISASCTLTAVPVTLNLIGTTVDGGALKVLTGQQITASLNPITGYSVYAPAGSTGYQWSIFSGTATSTTASATVFKNYDPYVSPPNNNQLVALSDMTVPSLAFYDWAAETIHATCAVTLLTFR